MLLELCCRSLMLLLITRIVYEYDQPICPAVISCVAAINEHPLFGTRGTVVRRGCAPLMLCCKWL